MCLRDGKTTMDRITNIEDAKVAGQGAQGARTPTVGRDPYSRMLPNSVSGYYEWQDTPDGKQP